MPRATWMLCVLAACARPPSPPPRVTAPAPPPIDAGVGMITEEECIARGDRVRTERDIPPSRAYPDREVRPFSVCLPANPKLGQACSDDRDCNNARCMCTGALARPDPENDPALRALDHTPGTGVCSDSPLPDGSWFCMVEDGTIKLAGIIIN